MGTRGQAPGFESLMPAGRSPSPASWTAAREAHGRATAGRSGRRKGRGAGREGGGGGRQQMGPEVDFFPSADNSILPFLRLSMPTASPISASFFLPTTVDVRPIRVSSPRHVGTDQHRLAIFRSTWPARGWYDRSVLNRAIPTNGKKGNLQ